MIEHFVNNVSAYVHTNPSLALIAVFVGGLLTASNPCVLAMIPLMMGVVAGRRETTPSVLRAFLYSLVFTVGLSVTFTALGMVTALAGKLYGDVSVAWSWIVAAVCVVMGLHLAGMVIVPIPSLGGRLPPKARGLAGSFVLGLLFGIVSAPCAAPILVVLLTYLAGSGSSVAWGGTLLWVYALGHSVLVLVAGTSMGAARTLIENKHATRTLALLRRTAGAVIILVGAYFGYRGLA
ncbi:MAG: cytochrome c biogenesis protein CcdA [Myxococcota bacterium]